MWEDLKVNLFNKTKGLFPIVTRIKCLNIKQPPEFIIQYLLCILFSLNGPVLVMVPHTCYGRMTLLTWFPSPLSNYLKNNYLGHFPISEIMGFVGLLLNSFCFLKTLSVKLLS